MKSTSARLCDRWIVYPRSCFSANARTACSSSGDAVSASAAAGNTLMRPCFAPCQAVNRSLMRCMPSSRSLGENLGASLLASPSGDIGPATFSLSRMDSANTQRRPVCANAAAERLMPPEFSTIVVVPVRMASNAPTVTISVASSP